ncbi:MAG: hypothetical protein GXP62_18230 [Oligoflexia bacterium]|nr:hypothetical protein [Oligoflexia bacterium]
MKHAPGLALLLTLCLPVSSSWAAAVGRPGVAVPLHGLDQPCRDQRFPTLAGPWVVACGPDGRVDRVLSLISGVEYRLPQAMISPGLSPGLLMAVGPDAGLIALQDTGPELLDRPRSRTPSIAAPATDGSIGAALYEGRVSAWPLDSPTHRLVEAHPVGWYPPALVPGLVAWVEDAGPDGEDVWAMSTTDRHATPRPLSAGPGNQRHVVSSGSWLAWVEPASIVLLDTATEKSHRIAAHTGFSAPPALWQDTVCWETRPDSPDSPDSGEDPQAGVDIRCSDGLDAAGPGHQRWPARFEGWLLYRQDGILWLKTAAEPGEARDPD